MSDCLIGLGTNLGIRQHTLGAAVEALRSHPDLKVVAVSSWLATNPIGGPTGQGEFLNGAVRLETSLSPESLLSVLQQIEQEGGRRASERWAARTLDLDLLLYGDQQIRSERLIVPHPRMAFRRFVLLPAIEIAAEMRHPQLGWSLQQLLEHLDLPGCYVAITGPPASGKKILTEQSAAATGGSVLFDPSQTGPTPSAEVEFLRRRAELLTRYDPPAENQPVVSDFWFGQSLAYASLNMPIEQQHDLRAAWDAANAEITQPKLIVMVLQPAAESPQQREIGRVVSSSRLCPILEVSAVDPDWAKKEVVAAVQAMQPLPT